MFDTLKLVFDTFGKDLMVPVMIFIICMIFKAPAKKSIFISSAGWCWSERYDIHYH